MLVADVGDNEHTPESLFVEAEIHKHKIDDATIAVRVFGNGPALVFIHGYPVYGYTWRKLLPALAKEFTCYVVDLPGLGDSDWTSDTDFSFTAQARRLSKLAASLNIEKYSLIAHNTGATIARLLTLMQPERVKKLVIINTELPNHRPPWIEFYQLSARLPFHQTVFRILLKNKRFVRSSMGFGQFYSDKKLFDDRKNLNPYLEPAITSSRRLNGMLNYLRGIDWDVVDKMKVEHKNIRADVLLLWGEDDKTFPVHLGEEMARQFSTNCRFVRISSASLMPQEERPDKVLEHLVPFLSLSEV